MNPGPRWAAHPTRQAQVLRDKMAARHRAKIATPHGLRTCFEARIQRDGKQDAGSPVRRDTPRTQQGRGPSPTASRTGSPPTQGADPPAPRERRCELCGEPGKVLVHQVRNLASLGKPGPAPAHVGGRHGRNARKTLVVCRPCHDLIHHADRRRSGIDHWRATCTERCPRGSEERPRGKGPRPAAPRRAPYPVQSATPGASARGGSAGRRRCTRSVPPRTPPDNLTAVTHGDPHIARKGSFTYKSGLAVAVSDISPHPSSLVVVGVTGTQHGSGETVHRQL